LLWTYFIFSCFSNKRLKKDIDFDYQQFNKIIEDKCILQPKSEDRVIGDHQINYIDNNKKLENLLFKKNNSSLIPEINKDDSKVLPQQYRFKKRSSIIRGLNSVPPLLISIPDTNYPFKPIIQENMIFQSNLYPRTSIHTNNFPFNPHVSKSFLGKRSNPFLTNSQICSTKNILPNETRNTIDTITKINSCVNIKNIDFQNSYDCVTRSEITKKIKIKKVSKTNSLSGEKIDKMFSDNISYNSFSKITETGKPFISLGLMLMVRIYQQHKTNI